jgi:2-C-methyl-D-erythritol 2,4-cyclodiphosphate synthase
MSLRVGQGIDVHRFSDDPHRHLVLGGVVIEGARGLAGHSDADAVSHALAAAEGFACVNADCTIVADTPRLAPHTHAMSEHLGRIVGAPVSVKATRAEGIGALGRAEGIACTAVVLLERP